LIEAPVHGDKPVVFALAPETEAFRGTTLGGGRVQLADDPVSLRQAVQVVEGCFMAYFNERQ